MVKHIVSDRYNFEKDVQAAINEGYTVVGYSSVHNGSTTIYYSALMIKNND